MNPVSSRLLGQQLICPQFRDPADVVSWMGAIQGQDYRAMRWAVAMRTRKPSFKAFHKAYDSGKIIRTHLLRTTWQLVCGEDLPWMISLCGKKAMAGLRGWMNSQGVSISQQEQEKVQDILVQLLSGGKSVFREDISEELSLRGTPMDDTLLGYHLRIAEIKGLICSGHLHASRNTYSLVAEKIPSPLSLSREEALSLLARKYFRSRGVATLEDFLWWSGLNVMDCRRGIDSLGKEIQRWTSHGREYLFMEESRSRGFRKGNVLLVPAFDEYLISYKSRDVVLDPDYAFHAHDKKGIFRHIVSLDGQIVGNWSPNAPGCNVRVFKEGVILPEESLSKELQRFHYAKTH